MKSTPEPMAFTIPEAAKLLGKTNWFVEEELRKGHIPFKWIGGAKMISRTDLEAYWNSLPYAPGSKTAPDQSPERLKFFRKLRRFNRRFKFARGVAGEAADALGPERAAKIIDEEIEKLPK